MTLELSISSLQLHLHCTEASHLWKSDRLTIRHSWPSFPTLANDVNIKSSVWHCHNSLDSPCSSLLGSLGWERLHWRRSKARKGQKCQSEDAWAGVCATPHAGSQQRHAQTPGATQVVLTHQGTVKAARRKLSGECVGLQTLFQVSKWQTYRNYEFQLFNIKDKKWWRICEIFVQQVCEYSSAYI